MSRDLSDIRALLQIRANGDHEALLTSWAS